MELPFVNLYRSRGKVYGYYRRHGLRLRIKGQPGTTEFLTNYQAIHIGFESKPAGPRLVDGSLEMLIGLYKASPDWHQLRTSTRADYEKSLTRLIDDFGREIVADCDRAAVSLIRDRYATRPSRKAGESPIPSPRMANKAVATLSILMSFAVEIGWRTDNPALRPKMLRTGGSYRPWTDAEIARFIEHAPALRLAMLRAVCTGQRAGDQVAMTWAAFDGNAIEVVQEKTKKLVWIPCHPELTAALAAIPKESRTAVTILTAPSGVSWEKPSQFQTAVSKAIRAAGLQGVVWHGLRSTAASWLAEAGCSDREIQAITGHETVTALAGYVRHADQKLRAQSAMTKLSARQIERPKNTSD